MEFRSCCLPHWAGAFYRHGIASRKFLAVRAEIWRWKGSCGRRFGTRAGGSATITEVLVGSGTVLGLLLDLARSGKEFPRERRLELGLWKPSALMNSQSMAFQSPDCFR